MQQLTTKTLMEMMLELRASIDQPLTIRPTQLIIGEREIIWWARRWKISRAKAIARIQRWARGV